MVASGQSDLETSESIQPDRVDQIGQSPQITSFVDYDGTGADIRLENMGVSVPGVSEMYYFEVGDSSAADPLAEGIIQVDTDTSGNRTVSMYRTGDNLADDIFIGSYTVDPQMRIIGATVGRPNDDEVDIDGVRKPKESYWDCVGREYKGMKEGVESRPLDDIMCSIGGMSWICKALAFAAAAYECAKEVEADKPDSGKDNGKGNVGEEVALEKEDDKTVMDATDSITVSVIQPGQPNLEADNNN